MKNINLRRHKNNYTIDRLPILKQKLKNKLDAFREKFDEIKTPNIILRKHLTSDQLSASIHNKKESLHQKLNNEIAHMLDRAYHCGLSKGRKQI